MNVEIILTTSVAENASIYFDKAKRAKKKLQGAIATIEKAKRELDHLKQQERQFYEKVEEARKKQPRKKEWYEKFHWFVSSEGFLCIGGKDATSNEVIIKKHTEQGDIVFHTDMAGSPFFVVKNGEEAGEETLNEAAQATASYSRAWKLGLGTTDVFYVKPTQVSKKAKSGEYLAKGSFMIYGNVTYLHPRLEIAIGLKDNIVIGGPVNAVKKHTSNVIVVVPGKLKKSDMAKRIRALLKDGELDDIMKFLPAGGCEMKKR
jgi:predicted ribosome quality control (RQC) complex YloA/Tae2 family protein